MFTSLSSVKPCAPLCSFKNSHAVILSEKSDPECRENNFPVFKLSGSVFLLFVALTLFQ